MPPIPEPLPYPGWTNSSNVNPAIACHQAPTFQFPIAKRRNIDVPVADEHETDAILDAGTEEEIEDDDDDDDGQGNDAPELTYSQRCFNIGKRIPKRRYPGT